MPFYKEKVVKIMKIRVLNIKWKEISCINYTFKYSTSALIFKEAGKVI